MNNLHTLASTAYPTLQGVDFPPLYESAKNSLIQCFRIDECQDWADKAAALASYAKQADDKALFEMAQRIQARAIRRCGELLKQVEPQQGGDKGKNQYGEWQRDNDVPLPTREQAATEAGLSERQRKTALRVATVPEDQFDEAVESDSPPTVARLAKLGTQKKPQPLVDLAGIPPEDYARATEGQGMLRRLAEYSRANDPARIAHAFKPHEIDTLKAHLEAIQAWLLLFKTHLGDRSCTPSTN